MLAFPQDKKAWHSVSDGLDELAVSLGRALDLCPRERLRRQWAKGQMKPSWLGMTWNLKLQDFTLGLGIVPSSRLAPLFLSSNALLAFPHAFCSARTIGSDAGADLMHIKAWNTSTYWVLSRVA